MKKMYLKLSALFSLIMMGNATFAQDNAPTPAALAPAKVISIFSDAFANVPGTNYNPNWGQATVSTIVTLSGTNQTLSYANLNYQGTEFTPVNAANMVFLHIDVYSTNETSLQVTPISPGKEFLVTLSPLTLNGWNSFDVPLSNFTGVDKSAIFQFKFVGSGGKTVLLDNLYFWDNTVADTELPTAFTATKGLVTSSSVELLLNATDNTNAINYTVAYGVTTVNVGGITATQKSYTIDNLLPSTAYSFSVTAKDAAGNLAANSPITVLVTTAGALAGAPTPPVLAADKVISIFSDSYTNINVSNFNPNWGQATQVSFVTLSGGNVALKYANLNYQGTEYASTNASSMTHLHIDVYTDNETSLKITPISPGKELLLPLTPLPQGSWKGFDIPLANFTGVDKAGLFQMKIEGSGGKTVYLDNIYYWNNATTTVVGPPAKPKAELPITFNDSSTVDYAIRDFEGTISMLTTAPGGSGLVLKTVRPSTITQPYAGTSIADLGLKSNIAFEGGRTTMSVKVYAEEVNTLICLKVEGPGVGSEGLAVTTAVGWNDLSFDFSKVVSLKGRTSQTIDVTKSYNKLVVFYNFFVTGATQGSDKTYYCDDIKLLPKGVVVGPVKLKPSLPMTFDDTTTVKYSIVDFAGDTLSAIVPDPTNASNLVLKTVRNPAVKGFEPYAGTVITDLGTQGPIPFAAGKTKVKARVYSPDAGTLICLKVEGAGTPTESLALTTAVGWNDLTFDFGVVSTVGGRNSQAIQSGKDYTKIIVFYNFFVPGATQGTAKTYYIDDIKFADGTTSVAKFNDNSEFSVFPNPSEGSFSIESRVSTSYQIMNASGVVVQSGVLAAGRNFVSSDLQNGIYFLRANGSVKKLVVRQ